MAYDPSRLFIDPAMSDEQVFAQPAQTVVNNQFTVPKFTGYVPQSTPVVVEPEFDAATRMSQLYQPEHQFSARLDSLISQMPKRENYNQGRVASILNGLVALRDPKYSEYLQDKPFNQALGEWETQYNSIKDLAALERQGNVNMRTVANNIISQEMRDKQLDRQTARDKVLQEQGNQRIDLAEQKAKSAEEKARNAEDLGNRKLEEQKRQFDVRQQLNEELANGGTLHDDGMGNTVLVNKKGEVVPLDFKVLSEEQKQAIRAKYQMSVKKTTTGNQDKPQIRVIDDPENPGQKIVVTVIPGQSTATPVVVNQSKDTGKPNPRPVATSQPNVNPLTTEKTKIAQLNSKAKQIAASNAKWGKYIEFDDKGNFTGITRPWIFSGPNNEMYNQIYQAIYDGANSQTTKPAQTAKPVDDKRQKAIDTLTKAKKPVTEANIKYVMEQMK